MCASAGIQSFRSHFTKAYYIQLCFVCIFCQTKDENCRYFHSLPVVSLCECIWQHMMQNSVFVLGVSTTRPSRVQQSGLFHVRVCVMDPALPGWCAEFCQWSRNKKQCRALSGSPPAWCYKLESMLRSMVSKAADKSRKMRVEGEAVLAARTLFL